MERHLQLRSRGFAPLAVSVLATAFALSARLATLDQPALIAMGMTLDLAPLLPVARPLKPSCARHLLRP